MSTPLVPKNGAILVSSAAPGQSSTRSSRRASILINSSGTAKRFDKTLLLDPDVDRKTLEWTIEREGNIREMRAVMLLGKSTSLFGWSSCCKDPNSIKGKAHKTFYERQNSLIQRYQEIDELLDSGIPVDMLKVYGNDEERRIGTPANVGSKSSRPAESSSDSAQGSPSSARANSTASAASPDAGSSEETPLLGSSSSREPASPAVVKSTIYLNFFINFVLLIFKLGIAFLSGSLSILASLVDAALDFLSTFIIWLSNHFIEKRDWKTKQLYPVGRNRLEPIGVLVFSVIIVFSFMKVASEAVSTLIESEGVVVSLSWVSIAVMLATIVVKIVCWILCKDVNSSAIQAIAQDAETDIVFNFFSILFPLVGTWFSVWWLDPLGALILSCYIVYGWASTAVEHISNLTGAAADYEDYSTLLYMCMRFSSSIHSVTSLRAYHVGDRLNVEVDVVLDKDLRLRDCHDIGEALQYSIETLPFVERAFVHLDYREGNYAGHLEQ